MKAFERVLELGERRKEDANAKTRLGNPKWPELGAAPSHRGRTARQYVRGQCLVIVKTSFLS